MQGRVLVVDDDATSARVLIRTLQEYGFRVQAAANRTEDVGPARTFDPQLIISNVSTSGADGLRLARQLEAGAQIPLMLITVRDVLHNRTELLERASALLSRPAGQGAPVVVTRQASDLVQRPANISTRNGADAAGASIAVDVHQRDAVVGGAGVQLTRTEFGIISVLVEQLGRVVPYDALLERIWGPPYRGERHLLQVHMQRLRLKLAAAGASRDAIRNRWGIGYVVDRASFVGGTQEAASERELEMRVAS